MEKIKEHVGNRKEPICQCKYHVLQLIIIISDCDWACS